MATNMEMPSISGSAHTHTTYTGTDIAAAASATGYVANIGGTNAAARRLQMQMLGGEVVRKGGNPILAVKLKEEEMSKKRYVQVFIADPDPKVQLAQSLLYSSEPKMTDATDQELFYEIEIKRILDEHNDKVRTKTIDKEIKDRTAYLEPARIRDLVMNVTTIAQFG